MYKKIIQGNVILKAFFTKQHIITKKNLETPRLHSEDWRLFQPVPNSFLAALIAQLICAKWTPKALGVSTLWNSRVQKVGAS